MTATTPVWRQAFDVVERRVAAGAETLVATDRFGDVAAYAARATAPMKHLLNVNTPVGDRLVDLADITSPLLCLVADKDHICPPAAAEPVLELVSSEYRRLVSVPAGHVGLVKSRTASKVALPALIDWFTNDLGAPS